MADEKKEPWLNYLALTTVIFAVCATLATFKGGGYSTRSVLSQAQASDQWAYYQAKSIRRYESEIARDLFANMKNEALSEQYVKNAEKYRKDDEEIQKEAKALEDESHFRGRQALRLHFGEVFLEVAIVFASLAILSKRSGIWYAAIALALVGVGIASTMLLLAKSAG